MVMAISLASSFSSGRSGMMSTAGPLASRTASMVLSIRSGIVAANRFASATMAGRERRLASSSNAAAPGYRSRKVTMFSTVEPRHW